MHVCGEMCLCVYKYKCKCITCKSMCNRYGSIYIIELPQVKLQCDHYPGQEIEHCHPLPMPSGAFWVGVAGSYLSFC